MSKTNNLVFKGLHVVAWIIFVGLCIEAGGLIVNFIYTVFNPDMVQYLYQKLDLTELYQASRVAFYSTFSFVLILSILKAHLFYLVVMLMHKIDLSNPFNSVVARQLSQISYFTLSIGLLSYLAREVASNLMHHGYPIDNVGSYWTDSQAFILMGAVIYIIATIFRKGVEIQNENELTV
ncbi:MAG: hypothetical protein BroJett042_16290 [Bacteroidota bacterium]|nr:MAG: hypothetical protein BroJett042_16290 [Bacteroidota bacterium]